MEKKKEPQKAVTHLTLIKKGDPEVCRDITDRNAAALSREMGWLHTVISTRMMSYQNEPSLHQECASIPEIGFLPELLESSYADFVKERGFTYVERLLLIVCIAANLRPDYFDKIESGGRNGDSRFLLYGGMRDALTKRFMPTLQTVLFLLSGTNTRHLVYYTSLLTEQNPVFRKQIVLKKFHEGMGGNPNDPELSIDTQYYHFFLTGTPPRLDYGEHFPAQLLTTEKSFEDLIVTDTAREKLEYALDFLAMNKEVYAEESTRKKIAPGYVMMLYGPPGTGKTLAATLLGKKLDAPVFKIDLAHVISKYIGDTEKSLEWVFGRLEGTNSILFFDEADALFGKRTEITDAKDRYANQEVSYLLQRLETWNGLAILSTNFQENLDEAFKRRIISYIYLGAPDVPERLKLWETIIPETYQYGEPDLQKRLAESYQLTGSHIATVIKLACFKVRKTGTNVFTREILNPILKELCFQHNINWKPL